MSGQFRAINDESQRQIALADLRDRPAPFLMKLSDPVPVKTTKQIRYAHSLSNAHAAYKQVTPDISKKDLKAAFGVVIVCTSTVTGDRSARLKSFEDYSKEEMIGFLSATEVYLDENSIPFKRAKDA